MTFFPAWSAGRNKWGDNTGRAHLMVMRDGFCFNACGSKAMTFGVSFATPEEAGVAGCERCLQCLAKLTRAKAHKVAKVAKSPEAPNVATRTAIIAEWTNA